MLSLSLPFDFFAICHLIYYVNVTAVPGNLMSLSIFICWFRGKEREGETKGGFYGTFSLCKFTMFLFCTCTDTSHYATGEGESASTEM